ncbi:hypothetical protein [Nonomuraea dietziae]|uniref:hypothetical protein n=1 Tax=Nonomuraea dietziae TaxID=65515 RepID=UPI0031D014DF
MAAPLQYGDPPRLGGFAVQARLSTVPAGLVYLGQGPDGRAVSIALLTRGAALDPSARERFVTAIRSSSGVRGWMARARGRTTTLDGPPVVAAELGDAPWVAVPYTPGRPGAERFLEPVMVGGTLIGEAHGPDFVPYWLADRAPALPAPPRPRPPADRDEDQSARRRRGAGAARAARRGDRPSAVRRRGRQRPDAAADAAHAVRAEPAAGARLTRAAGAPALPVAGGDGQEHARTVARRGHRRGQPDLGVLPRQVG